MPRNTAITESVSENPSTSPCRSATCLRMNPLIIVRGQCQAERRNQHAVAVADESGFRIIAPRVPHLIWPARRSCAPRYHSRPAMPRPAPDVAQSRHRKFDFMGSVTVQRHQPAALRSDPLVRCEFRHTQCIRNRSHRQTSDGFHGRLRLSLADRIPNPSRH